MNQPNQPGKNNASDGAHMSVSSLDMSSLGQLEEIFAVASQPGTPVGARPRALSDAQQPYTPSNAVHMEIQENAKLPTFNLPVDRTNSSHTRTSNLKIAPDTKSDLDEILRLSEHDVNLTEMFLGSRDRSSVNMNWNTAGALLSHIGEVFDGDGDSSARQGSVMSEGSTRGLRFVHHQPPVPLSVHVPHGAMNRTPMASPMNTAKASAPGPADSFELGKQDTPGQQYPYHRSLPLPIPKRLSPETTTSSQAGTVGSDTVHSNGTTQSTDVLNAAALATAAAIATHRQTSIGSHGLASSTSPSKSAKRPRKTNPGASKKPRPCGKATRAAKPTAKRSPAQYRSAVPSASMKEATEKRSKFGFGENHVVPSVPGPPPARKPQRRPKPPPPSVNNSADAYERKKQKAKESRVKLNEAIERTGIAISLSGTQSRQRAAQLNTIRVSSAGLRANTLHTLEECARISGEAKKWDRPSFVGTAASLIQALNAQCEALMSEMLELKRQEGNSPVAALAVGSMNEDTQRSGDGAGSSTLPPGPSIGDNGMQGFSSEDYPPQNSPKRAASWEENESMYATAKRPRLEQQLESAVGMNNAPSSITTIHTIISSTPSVQTLATMLDPRTLIRCSEVSRVWHNVFQGDPAWLNLCLDRFGPYKVRQWKDKMEAEHLPPCASISLYRKMDAANVKPHCLHEGSLSLGEARMSGKVSAWVSMVERSNGETIRSVVKESDPQSYTSLPVVELRLLIQNSGSADFPIVLEEQSIAVDASTRRRGEELKEIQWDSRFQKKVLNLDGSQREPTTQINNHDVVGDLCRLKLFESVILVAHVHARGCSTTSKFQQKSNFTKILVKINGTTMPLVVPFVRESNIN